MSESEPRRRREHNAKGTREAILNAAEAVFAEHGYDGARLDAIAQVSSYNKSLIGQYFGDKLGLYMEVTRRIDKDLNELQTHLLAPLLADETVASDAYRFRIFLETIFGTLFDYLLAHPRVIRIILWEQAEGWQTYTKILSQLETDDVDLFRALFSRAHRAGLLRSDIDPLIQLTQAEHLCWSYLASIPLYQMFIEGKDLSSAIELARAREYIVSFLVNGMVTDPKDKKAGSPASLKHHAL
jgi:AcrR family transcriptional regulator